MASAGFYRVGRVVRSQSSKHYCDRESLTRRSPGHEPRARHAVQEQGPEAHGEHEVPRDLRNAGAAASLLYARVYVCAQVYAQVNMKKVRLEALRPWVTAKVRARENRGCVDNVVVLPMICSDSSVR
jgi:hypothetical protein